MTLTAKNILDNEIINVARMLFDIELSNKDILERIIAFFIAGIENSSDKQNIEN